MGNRVILDIYQKIKVALSFGSYSPSQIARELFAYPFDLIRRSGRSSSLLSVDLFITGRCNLKCSMCNVVPIIEKSDCTYKDPTIDEVKSWIDQLAKYSPYICLMGGEPLIRKDIGEIVQYISNKGMRCGLYTNGTPMSAESLLTLCKSGIDNIVFSLHGTKPIHEKIVDSKVNYDGIEEKVKLLISNGIDVGVSLCLQPENLHNINEFSSEIERWGVRKLIVAHPSFLYSSELADSKNCSQQIKVVEKSPLDSQKVLELYRKDWSSIPSLQYVPKLDQKGIENWYGHSFEMIRGCRVFSYRGCCIFPNGDVVSCEQLGNVMGNINQENFKDIYNNKLYREFRKRVKNRLVQGCERCCQL